MNLMRWDPYREVAGLQDRFNRAYGRTEREDEVGLAAWAPPVDIAEEKDKIVITAEPPTAAVSTAPMPSASSPRLSRNTARITVR